MAVPAAAPAKRGAALQDLPARQIGRLVVLLHRFPHFPRLVASNAMAYRASALENMSGVPSAQVAVTRSPSADRRSAEILLGHERRQVAAAVVHELDGKPGSGIFHGLHGRRHGYSGPPTPARASLVRSVRTAMARSPRSITLWAPMKRATKAVLGRLNRSSAVPFCSMRAGIHEHHEVGQRQGLVLAVGDVNEGDVRGFSAAASARHAPATARKGSSAESGSSRRRTDGRVIERARKRHALLLPAGQLRRAPFGITRSRSTISSISCALMRRSTFGIPFHLEGKGDVLGDCQMREQSIALEHHRRSAPGRRQERDVGIVEEDIAGS